MPSEPAAMAMPGPFVVSAIDGSASSSRCSKPVRCTTRSASHHRRLPLAKWWEVSAAARGACESVGDYRVRGSLHAALRNASAIRVLLTSDGALPFAGCCTNLVGASRSRVCELEHDERRRQREPCPRRRPLCGTPSLTHERPGGPFPYAPIRRT